MDARVVVKQKSRKSQRGAAALEFAVVVPVLMLLVCGMVDLGLLFNGQAVVTNGARDGVRAASLGKDFTGTGTVIANETTGLTNSSGVGWSVCIDTTIDGPFSTCSTKTSTNPGAGSVYDNARAIDSIVRVTVSYPYTWITPLPTWIGQGATITVTQVSYMRIEDAP